MRKKHLILGTLFIIITGIYFAGCDAGGGITIPSGSSELTVNVKADDNANDAIIITEAKALISDLEFEKQSNGKDELHKKGPFVFNFNLAGGMAEMSNQRIIRDIFTKAKFIIHKPEATETPSDPEFKEGTTPDKLYSFIIKGTYNGNSFVYKSKKGTNVIISIPSTTNINISRSNITIVFNKTKWFKNGNNEINPNDPQFENLIDENIRTSFVNAFRDDNKDGVADN